MPCSPGRRESPAHWPIMHIKSFTTFYVKLIPQVKWVSRALPGLSFHAWVAGTQWVNSQGGATSLKGLYSPIPDSVRCLNHCDPISGILLLPGSNQAFIRSSEITLLVSRLARTCVYGNTQDSKLTTRTAFLQWSLEPQSKIMDHNMPNCPLVQTEG